VPPASGPTDPFAAVAQIRERRVRARPAQTLEREMDRALADVKRQRRSIAGCAAAWRHAVPPELAERTSLESFARGVLLVRVPDAATRFHLDRFLKAGGWSAFTRSCSASVKSVRIVVGG